MKKVIIIAFLAVLLAISVKQKLVVKSLFRQTQKIYQDLPTAKTIYEQNNNSNFPKTRIQIPKISGYLIAVYKDAHKLKLLENNQVIKEYNVNLRRELEDRKTWDDNQTPEGIFHIETMDIVDDPIYIRWMRLNTLDKAKILYLKTYQDAQKHLADFEHQYGKLTSDASIKKFNSIYKDEKMLEGIGIHGGGFSLYHDWTWGCIALEDKDVIELFDLLNKSQKRGIGTTVIVQD